jgi:hypothetical protein
VGLSAIARDCSGPCDALATGQPGHVSQLLTLLTTWPGLLLLLLLLLAWTDQQDSA